MKKRGAISNKEALANRVKYLAKDCADLSTLKEKLVENSIQVYARGTHVLTGVWIGNRRFRLTTLGISKEHFRAMSKEEERLREAREKRTQNEHDNTRNYE